MKKKNNNHNSNLKEASESERDKTLSKRCEQVEEEEYKNIGRERLDGNGR